MSACLETKAALNEILTLKADLERELDEAAKTGNLVEAKNLRQKIELKISELREEIDPYSFGLRRRLAAETGAYYVSAFHEGLAVANTGRSIFIDKIGHQAFPRDFLKCEPFSEGLAPVVFDNGDRTYMDKTGKFPFPFSKNFLVIQSLSEGFAKVTCKSELGQIKSFYIDKSGNQAFELKGALSPEGSFHNGLARVFIGKSKHGYINKTGDLAFSDEFDWTSDYSDGLALVKEFGKYVFIDQNGDQAISDEFEFASPFSEGLALVQKGDERYFINKSGQRASEIIDPSIYIRWEDHPILSAGRLRAIKSTSGNSEFVFINREGKQAFPGNFKNVTEFFDGVAHVFTDFTNKETYYIDPRGRRIFSEKPETKN